MSLESIDADLFKVKNVCTALYFKTGTVLQVEKQFDVISSRSYRPYLNKLMEFPDLERGSFAFERCLNKILGITMDTSKHQQYSEMEMKNGLYHYCIGEWSPADVLEKCGIPKRTICDKKNWLMAFMGYNGEKSDFGTFCCSNSEFLHRIIWTYEMKGKTKKPYLDESEAALVAVLCSKVGETGYGNKNRKGYRLKLKEVIHESGKYIAEAAEMSNDAQMLSLGNRMSTAKITHKTAREYSGVVRLAPLSLGDGNLQPKFRKPNLVSSKRAAAGDPKLDVLMHNLHMRQFQQDYDDGLSPTPVPGADQMINGDEVGLPPMGHTTATFTLGSPFSQWRTVHGEKNAYWVSVLWCSRADGITTPPIVVHQGGTEDKLPAKFTHGLPDNFGVHCSPSGYMDQLGFRGFCEMLVCELKPQKGHMQYFFIDGHDSHFDPTALQYLLDNHIRAMFLKANDSINDQPQDNGMNASFKSHYDQALDEWRQAWANVPFTPEFMNTVIARAWQTYTANPALPGIIKRAFEKTGIFPYKNILERNPEKAVMAAKLCEVFCRDERDREELKKMKSEFADRNGMEFTDSTAVATADGRVSSGAAGGVVPISSVSFADVNMKTVITGFSAPYHNNSSPDNNSSTSANTATSAAAPPEVITPTSSPNQFHIVVNKGVGVVIQKCYVKPVNELNDALDAHNKLRNINIDKPAKKSCRNPNTTIGACVNASLLDKIRQAQDNKAEKIALAEERKKESVLKKGKVAVELAELRAEFLTFVETHSDAWKIDKDYSKRTKLDKVYKALGGPLALKDLPKKEHVVAAIDILLIQIRGGGGGVGEEEGAFYQAEESDSSDEE